MALTKVELRRLYKRVKAHYGLISAVARQLPSDQRPQGHVSPAAVTQALKGQNRSDRVIAAVIAELARREAK